MPACVQGSMQQQNIITFIIMFIIALLKNKNPRAAQDC